jgi:uncharacterized repeat protein (TIGR01451 family)
VTIYKVKTSIDKNQMRTKNLLILVTIFLSLDVALNSQSLSTLELELPTSDEIREARSDGENLIYITRNGLYRVNPFHEVDSFLLPSDLTLSSNSLSNIFANNFAINSFGQISLNAKRGSSFVTISTSDNFATFNETETPRGRIHYFGKDTIVAFSGVCSDFTFPTTSYSIDNGENYISSNSSLCPLPFYGKTVRINNQLHLFGSNSSTNGFDPNADCYTNSYFSIESMDGSSDRFRDPSLDFNERNCNRMNTTIESNGTKYVMENIFDTLVQVPLYGAVSPIHRPFNIGTVPSGLLYVNPISREHFIVSNNIESSRIFHRRSFTEEFEELLLIDSIGIINNIEFDDFGNFFLISHNKIFYSTGVEQFSNRISGKYFLDLDSSCAYDSLDILLDDNRLFYSTDGSREQVTFINDGLFSIGVEEGETTFNSGLDDTVWGICPNKDKVTVTNDSVYLHNIPVMPIRDCNDISITYGSTPLVRCFTSRMEINIQNTGSKTASNFITDLQLNSNLEITSSNIPYNQNSNTYSFSIDSLTPFQSSKIILEIFVTCDIDLGKEVCLTSLLTNITESCYEDMAFTFCDIIVGSFDPNDITVFNQMIKPDNVFEKEETILYRIRFQNTGTADAFNVRIENPINDKLNLATLEIINSSDNYEVLIQDDSLIFYFDNINLPSVDFDSLGSQGFITYKINSYPDIEYGSIVDNSASIFFDFNEPIETNNSEVIIDRPSSTSSLQKQRVRFSPSPTSDILNLIDNNNYYTSYKIYDLTGKVLDGGVINSNSISMGNKGIIGLVVIELSNETGDREVSKVVVVE